MAPRPNAYSEAGMGQRLFEGLTGLFGNTSGVSTSERLPQSGGYTPNHGHSMAAPASSPYSNNEYCSDSHDEPADNDETSEREDLLDQHVAYYLKHHSEVHSKNNISRIRPGEYKVNGRELTVEWYYADDPSEQGYLIAIDGPLRQPFSDYMEHTEKHIQYDDKRLGRSSLSQIPKGKRLSFGDGNKVYSRLEAMKVAKEQALVREKAADFVNNGMEVPQQELMSKYKKTLSQKLGEKRQRKPEPQAAPTPPQKGPEPQMVAPSPVASSPPPPAAASPAPAPLPAGTTKPNQAKKQTHGAPKYCANHDRTERRKKTKPKHEPCATCKTVIQTNYVEFVLCPACSEKDHRCMCCGATAVGAAATPQACPQEPSSPMRSSQQRDQSRSPQPQQPHQSQQPPAPMSPMNLFGMPDLFTAAAANAMPSTEPQSSAAGAAISSAWQGLTSQAQAVAANAMTPQKNAYVSQNPYASQNAYASQNVYASPQNVYASQNAFASYNPMASQSPMPAGNPLASQNIYVGGPRRF